MIRKKYDIYGQEKQTIENSYHYNRFNSYTTVITIITKLYIAINILHSPEINIQ